MVYSQGILQKVSGAIKISEQDKQKVEKSGTTVNGHSIQPVSSSTQRTETIAVGDHTKVSVISAYWSISKFD